MDTINTGIDLQIFDHDIGKSVTSYLPSSKFFCFKPEILQPSSILATGRCSENVRLFAYWHDFKGVLPLCSKTVCSQWEAIFHVICQTRETMFYHISKYWEESWKYDSQWSIFDELRKVWKCGEPLSLMFDISFQRNPQPTSRLWSPLFKPSELLISLRLNPHKLLN